MRYDLSQYAHVFVAFNTFSQSFHIAACNNSLQVFRDLNTKPLTKPVHNENAFAEIGHWVMLVNIAVPPSRNINANHITRYTQNRKSLVEKLKILFYMANELRLSIVFNEAEARKHSATRAAADAWATQTRFPPDPTSTKTTFVVEHGTIVDVRKDLNRREIVVLPARTVQNLRVGAMQAAGEQVG